MVRGSMGSWVTGSVILLRQEAGHLGVVQKAQGVGRLGAREQQVQHLLIGKRIQMARAAIGQPRARGGHDTHSFVLSVLLCFCLLLCLREESVKEGWREIER